MLKNLLLITLLLGVTYSTASIAITSQTACGGTLTITDSISADTWAWTYKIKDSQDEPTANANAETATFDVSQIANGGTYTVSCTATKDPATETATFDVTVYNCSADPTIAETDAPSGCTGTYTGTESESFANTSIQWYYQSTASGSSQQTGPTTDAFDLSTIALNGTYDLWIVYSKTDASQTAYQKGVELSGCPTSVEISAGTAVSGCTGTFTVAATNFTPTTYAWTYTSSVSGATATPSSEDTATFDVSDIKVSGTYTLGVTVTDGQEGGVSKTATLTTGALTGCEPSTGGSGSGSDDDDDDDDDDSANILSVLAIFLLALVL